MKKRLYPELVHILTDMRALKILFGLIVLAGLGYGISSLIAPTVVVHWSTGSELNTVGFFVYRSEHPSEGYERITPELLPASGDTLAGGSYTWVDDHVKVGHRYYYLLEDVDSQGQANQYGPISANRVGLIEIGLSGLLFCIGLLGLGLLFRQGRRIKA